MNKVQQTSETNEYMCMQLTYYNLVYFSQRSSLTTVQTLHPLIIIDFHRDLSPLSYPANLT